MIMIDRHRQLSEPLRWGRREKVVIATVFGVLVLVVASLGAYGLTSGSRARSDCINVTFASTLGGARLHACGRQARLVCSSAGAYKGIADALSAACRRAGFPYLARG